MSFEADETAFPSDAADPPPGREVAEFVSESLRASGLDHEGPFNREGWAWELRTRQPDVEVTSIIALTDDPPMQWQIHTHGRVPRLKRLLDKQAAGRSEQLLTQWCEAVDRALKRDDRFRSIRWYDLETFDRDHGETWADAPRA